MKYYQVVVETKRVLYIEAEDANDVHDKMVRNGWKENPVDGIYFGRQFEDYDAEEISEEDFEQEVGDDGDIAWGVDPDFVPDVN